MDPPWENASARRSSSYMSLPSRRILNVPIQKLMSQGGILLMWVTNRQRHMRLVREELLVRWGMEVVGVWYWLKVTDGGQAVLPLDSRHRQPYEPLLLLRFRTGPRPPGDTRAAGPGITQEQQEGQVNPTPTIWETARGAQEEHPTNVPDLCVDPSPSGVIQARIDGGDDDDMEAVEGRTVGVEAERRRGGASNTRGWSSCYECGDDAIHKARKAESSHEEEYTRSKKRPRPVDTASASQAPSSLCDVNGQGMNTNWDGLEQVPRHLVVVSVPGAHSRKPPVGMILQSLLRTNNLKCLEMFARSLMPGWTSWGNEVLKFQEVGRYLKRKM